VELIDSSAWIEFFRRTGSRANVAVREMMQERPGDVAITEPVMLELLAGAPGGRAFSQIEKLTGALQLLPVDAAVDYRDAAMAHRAVRRGGNTVRKTMDCLIAAVAARTGATLVHRDRDFDVLAAALPDLRVRSLV
jgi:predicted nucleic acid-binding protein